MLDLLAAAGEITHFENSDHPDGTQADPQNRAYDRFWEMSNVKDSDWVLVADADEFLNIHVGDGTLNALFAALDDVAQGRVDVLSATWRVFGNSGIVAFEDLRIGLIMLVHYLGFSHVSDGVTRVHCPAAPCQVFQACQLFAVGMLCP